MTIETDNTKKLADLMKPHEKSFDILQEALQEVSAEQAEDRKKKAKELIRQAIDLQKQMDAAEKQFLSSKRGFDKQLGKLMGQLKNFAGDKPLDAGTNEEEESSSEE